MADNMIEKLGELSTEFKSAIDRADTAATDRLNTAISDLETKMRATEADANRPLIDTNAISDMEAKSAFDSYLRGNQAEYKAMSATGTNEGGVTIPKVMESTLRSALISLSPMRSIADVVSVSTPDYHIPFALQTAGSSWVAEKGARTESAAPQIVDVTLGFGEMFAQPFVTQTILEDSQYDIASLVTNQVATKFAIDEGTAFVNGTGVNQPKGFLLNAPVATADATRAFGTIQSVNTGAAADITADALVAFPLSFGPQYRLNGSWLMNRATLAKVRTMKDTTGQYLWANSIVAGLPSTLCGYPVYEIEDMDSVGAGKFPIAFGDFKRGYTIADRVGMSVLYNPYAFAPYIAYQTRARVGGGLVDSNAIKVLKCSA